MPKTGKLEIKSGNMAQCIAHVKEEVIPMASQLILSFIIM